MKVLVFGKTGQVARELETMADVVSLGREEADISDAEACAGVIRYHAPEAVINAAAYTAVDRAEDELALATCVNGSAPAVMAKTCAELGIPFVHISTDYVFDGSGDKPWTPSDLPAPKNAYGITKLIGEEGVRSANGCYAILRTSWVFSEHGSNFVFSMLKLAEGRNALRIVRDQVGGPTPARDVAKTCLAIVDQLAQNPTKSGTYHFSGTPNVSWQEFAEAIFEQANREVSVEGIPTREYPTPAARPLNSRLDCSSLEKAFGITRPDWRVALQSILENLEITR